MLKVRIIRHFNEGNAIGGHSVNTEVAFVCPFPCAAVEFRLGFETVWLTRDEALEVADALRDAARDG